ncbi:hypothetical protein MmiEs2_09080 [Methanimicrococcus stummii]|uniref:Uncharacterized protein n=1 Tax=Methanimicrococcus stummii TaxID=3028294 RepID=A0AA96VAF9_9EURY|nr:hypothetical protein [Methanimicrococcus sp. Es2]WNY28705.1 hypothetical protein MmiEs2_09080 [Methanimicrococcus sp. Es2]
MTTIKESWTTFQGVNQPENLAPGENKELKYGGVKLSRSIKAGTLPFLGCKIYNASDSSALQVFFNGNEDRGDVIDAGHEQIFSGFVMNDINLINKGEEPIAGSDIHITIFSSHDLLRDYYDLKEKETKYGKIVAVGGGDQ